MQYKHYECVECDAVFKIKHDLETDYYQVCHCPFCGAGIDEDQIDDYEEE